MDGSCGMPLVSVVTPSLNQAAFIEATIRSVMCQDYASIEHIVIDGGSRDGTVDVLKKYPHLRWVSEPDSGPAEAINKGWLRSRGDILSCLGSGDMLASGAVRSVVELFRSEPGLQMVYGDVNVMDEDGNPGSTVKSAPFSLYRLFLNSYICPQAVFVRRGLLSRVGMLDEGLLCANDYDLYLRIATAGCAMRYVPRVLANYRFHRLSIGTRVGQRRGDGEKDLVLARSWPRVNGFVQRMICRAACRGNVGIRRHVRRGYEDYAAGRIGQAMKRVLAGVAYYPPLILEKCVFHLFCVAAGRLLMGGVAFKWLKTRLKAGRQ